MNIIQSALEYYDKNNEKYKSILKKIKYISYSDKNEYGDVICSFFDKDEKLIFKSKVEIIGKYFVDTNLWVWGWSVPLLDKSLTGIIRNVFLYGTELYNTNATSDIYILRQQLLTSRFFITDNVQIDIYIALSSYLSKNKVTLKLPTIKYTKGKFAEDKYDTEKINITECLDDDGAFFFITDPPVIDD